MTSYPLLNAAELKVQKQQSLKKTTWDFGQTGIFTAAEEQGETNLGTNTTVGFQQQNIDLFSIPAKTKLQEARIAMAGTSRNLNAKQITREVKIAYGKAYTARRKLVLMQQIDSVFEIFQKAVELKYQVDESSGLEYLAASNQARQIAVQTDQARYDYQMAVSNLNKWILGDTVFTVDPGDLQWLEPLLTDDRQFGDHPELQLARDQILISEKSLEAQKAGYLPKLNLMYGIQEVDGVEGFYQYQAGLSFPLIFNKQQGMVQAAAIEREISQQNLATVTVELQNQFQVATANYRKWLDSWQYYQQEAIPMARQQLDGAALAYHQGAIDYVAFLHHTHSALEIELNGLEALDAYLQSKFHLEYLLNK